VIERLIAGGRATRPIGDLLDIPPPEGEISTKLSEALEETRQE